MGLTGKQKAVEKANKLFEERELIKKGVINESKGVQVGTPIVTLNSKMKGTIIGIQYIVELKNGETVALKEGDFYNDSDPDLPF
jgi:hypothetical protein